MNQSDTQESDREPTRESSGPDQPTETRADVLAMTILSAIFGGFMGWLFAWGADMSIIWQIATAIAGTIILGGLILIRPFRQFCARPALALRWASQEDNTHKPVGDVVVGYMQRREGWTVLNAVICGAIGGGTLGWVVGGPVGSMYGAAIGAVVWLVFSVLLVALFGAIWVEGARTFGPIVNTTCSGALFGAVFGMEIWHRYWGVARPNIGALVVGIPMAALFLLAGYSKSKKPKSQSRIDERNS